MDLDDCVASNGDMSKKSIADFKIPLRTPKDENEGVKHEPGKEEVFISPLTCAVADKEPEKEETIKIEKSEAPKRKLDDEKPKPSICGRDNSYPEQLNQLFQPLRCNLCNAELNSVITERAHYQSKTHFKKVTRWVNEWSQMTGEPAPKVQKLFRDGPTGPDAFYCEACDLKLNSSLHASQHYNGKRHKMVIANISNPSGSGFYNSEGKWVRQHTKVKHNDSRFGIGEAFRKDVEVNEPKTNQLKTEEQKPIEPKAKTAKTVSKAKKETTQCLVCNIAVSSSQQMEMHLLGSKHAKKLKALGAPPYVRVGDTVLASLKKGLKTDVSIYRTPSGSYYCKTCNVSLKDETVFKNHLESKRHSKNLKKLTNEN